MSHRVLRVILVFVSQLIPGYGQEAAAGASHVAVTSGRISIRAEEVPLKQLADEIRQASGIHVADCADADAEMVSVNIDAPLEQGLRILLGRYDSVFLYSASDSGPAVLKKIWIYHKGRADGLEPAEVGATASTRELREKLKDPDPVVRQRAFQLLISRPGREEHDAIMSATLAERDDGLRASMLEALASSGLELSAEFWNSFSSDPSEHVRLLVLDALEGTPGIGDIAVPALNDPSPHIRQRAKDILDTLKQESEQRPQEAVE